MKKSEVLEKIKEQRNESHCFVKWWRKENDFIDYELIDKFIEIADDTKEMEGFSLLTMNDMWDELQRIAGPRVKLLHNISGDKVEWVNKGKSGTNTQVCTYTPETLITIFDVETKGNPIG